MYVCAYVIGMDVMALICVDGGLFGMTVHRIFILESANNIVMSTQTLSSVRQIVVRCCVISPILTPVVEARVWL